MNQDKNILDEHKHLLAKNKQLISFLKQNKEIYEKIQQEKNRQELLNKLKNDLIIKVNK